MEENVTIDALQFLLFTEDIKQQRPINEYGNVDCLLSDSEHYIYLTLLDYDSKAINTLIMAKQ